MLERKVIRAKVTGFCMGVRQAVETACCEIEKNSRGNVYTLGPLIHNPHVLEELESRGLKIIDLQELPENFNGAAVIIRAHGVSLQTEADLQRRGVLVIDATCPKVKSSQLKAAEFSKAGYFLFLAGDESHAEIAGIRGYYETTETEVIIVNSPSMAEKSAKKLFAISPNAKTALIGQTTISAEEYKAIGSVISHYFPDLVIVNTICNATKERQDSLRELTGKVDGIIIAGGKDSANTRRLYDIAKASGKPCTLAEKAADIPKEFFSLKTIGLAAGTSTPDYVIKEIEERIRFYDTKS